MADDKTNGKKTLDKFIAGGKAVLEAPGVVVGQLVDVSLKKVSSNGNALSECDVLNKWGNDPKVSEEERTARNRTIRGACLAEAYDYAEKNDELKDMSAMDLRKLADYGYHVRMNVVNEPYLQKAKKMHGLSSSKPEATNTIDPNKPIPE